MWLGSHVALSASAGFVGRGGRNKAEVKQEFIKKRAPLTMRVCVMVGTSGLQPSRVGGEESVHPAAVDSRGVFLEWKQKTLSVLPVGGCVDATVIKKTRL